jgi:plastocyanin
MFTFTRRAARRRMLPLAVACTLLGLAAPASAAEITIKIDNFVFVPDTVTIKPGDVVTCKTWMIFRI